MNKTELPLDRIDRIETAVRLLAEGLAGYWKEQVHGNAREALATLNEVKQSKDVSRGAGSSPVDLDSPPVEGDTNRLSDAAFLRSVVPLLSNPEVYTSPECREADLKRLREIADRLEQAKGEVGK